MCCTDDAEEKTIAIWMRLECARRSVRRAAKPHHSFWERCFTWRSDRQGVSAYRSMSQLLHCLAARRRLRVSMSLGDPY